jgi:hypothetical protein
MSQNYDSPARQQLLASKLKRGLITQSEYDALIESDGAPSPVQSLAASSDVVAKSLQPSSTSKPRITDSSGNIVEGCLLKRSDSLREWKVCKISFDSESMQLTYFKDPDDEEYHASNKAQAVKVHMARGLLEQGSTSTHTIIIQASNVRALAAAVYDSEELTNTFEFRLRAGNAEEAKLWLRELKGEGAHTRQIWAAKQHIQKEKKARAEAMRQAQNAQEQFSEEQGKVLQLSKELKEQNEKLDEALKEAEEAATRAAAAELATQETRQQAELSGEEMSAKAASLEATLKKTIEDHAAQLAQKTKDYAKVLATQKKSTATSEVEAALHAKIELLETELKKKAAEGIVQLAGDTAK